MKKVILVIVLIMCIFIAALVIIHNGSEKEEPDVEPTITALPSEDTNDAHVFSRPEERGENLSILETSEVVKRFTESNDKIELRKAAKVLGDRSIAGSLKLSDGEKQGIDKVVQKYIEQAKAEDSQDRGESRQQIHRLWHVAMPKLLEYVGSKEVAEAELAIKSLILMRNETVVKALIERAKTAGDDPSKAMYIFALRKMKEQRESLIPGRECLNEDESAAMYNRLLVPVLAELQENK